MKDRLWSLEGHASERGEGGTTRSSVLHTEIGTRGVALPIEYVPRAPRPAPPRAPNQII